MPIFQKYILKKFLLIHSVALVSLVLFFLLFSVLEKLDGNTIASAAHFFKVVWKVMLNIPSVVFELLPITTLIASTITLSLGYGSYELIAARAAGLSELTLLKYFIQGSIFLIILAYLCSEWLIPLRQKQLDHGTDLQRRIWIKQDGSFISFKPTQQTTRITDVISFFLKEHSELDAILYGRQARLIEEKWIVQNPKKIVLAKEQLQIHDLEKTDLPLMQAPVPAQSNINNQSLWYLSARLTENHLSIREQIALKIALVRRISLPVMLWTMIGISFLLVHIQTRNHTMLPIVLSILLGIVIGYSYETLARASIGSLYLVKWLGILPIMVLCIILYLLIRRGGNTLYSKYKIENK